MILSKEECFAGAIKVPVEGKEDELYELLLHTDTDGVTVAAEFSFTGKKFVVKYCSNGTMSKDIRNAICDDENAKKFKMIIACDISCNEEDAIAIAMSKNKNKLIIIDHHDTALNLNKYSFAFIQSDILSDSFRTRYYNEEQLKVAHSSGTSLMYDYLEYCGFFKEQTEELATLQEIVHLVAGYDTWDWVKIFGGKKEFKDINTIFNFYSVNTAKLYIEHTLEKIKNHEVFDKYDKMTLEVLETNIANYVTSKEKAVQLYQAVKFDFDERVYSAAYLISKEHPQETFEMMMKSYPGYELYIIDYCDGYSIRTEREDIHVGNLLANIGGGGHQGAAGLRVPFNVINDRMESDLHITSIISYR